MTSPLIDSSAYRHHVDRYLEPLRRDLTTKRTEAWKKLKFRAAISSVLLIAMAGFGWWGYRSEEEFYEWLLAFIVFAIGLALFLWCAAPWRRHRGRLKHDVLTRLVPFFGDFSFLPDASLSPAGFAGRGLLPVFTHHYATDEVQGSHRGVPLRAAEVTLLREYQTSTSMDRAGSSKGVETVFKGVLMEIGLPHPVAGTVVVGSPDLFLNRFAVRDDEGLQRLDLPCKNLEAWADDAGAAARLVSGPLLERVATLVSRGRVRSLRLSWHGQTLAILLDFGENFFELPMRGEIDFSGFGAIVQDQLSRLTMVIDLLEVAEPSGDADTRMRPLDERMPQCSELPEDFEQRDLSGWLPVVILTVVGFCTYLWLLTDQVRPLGALGLASVFGVMAGANLGYVLSRGLRGLSRVPMLLIGLLGISPALPDETLDRLPGGQYVKEIKLER